MTQTIPEQEQKKKRQKPICQANHLFEPPASLSNAVSLPSVEQCNFTQDLIFKSILVSLGGSKSGYSAAEQMEKKLHNQKLKKNQKFAQKHMYLPNPAPQK